MGALTILVRGVSQELPPQIYQPTHFASFPGPSIPSSGIYPTSMMNRSSGSPVVVVLITTVTRLAVPLSISSRIAATTLDT